MNLVARYPSGGDLRLGFDAFLADLVFDNERTEDTEAALADLAEHLGIRANVPSATLVGEVTFSGRSNSDSFAVIEAKSGAAGNMIWKKDINELAGSVNWCKEEYGAGASVVPVIMHPMTVVEKTRNPSFGHPRPYGLSSREVERRRSGLCNRTGCR